MKRIIPIISLLLILMALSFLLGSMINPTGYVVKEVENETNQSRLRTLTKAFCTEEDGLTYCEDKLIVYCGDKWTVVESVNGNAVMGRNWTDPRN